MSCKICETRRPRRFCPGVGGDICSVCCGTEREVTVSCPLSCEYLQDARRHERLPDLKPEDIPNQDIRVTESFLENHTELIALTSLALLEGAANTPGAVDYDVREALDTLVRTYRTLESGLIYESRPANPLAANIHLAVCNALVEAKQRMQERTGLTAIRDVEILGALAFLQRLEISHNNGRRRGRAFLDFLRQQFPAPASPIVGGGTPLIVG